MVYLHKILKKIDINGLIMDYNTNKLGNNFIPL